MRGRGELRGLRQWVQLYIGAQIWKKKLWRCNFIYNLCSRQSWYGPGIASPHLKKIRHFVVVLVFWFIVGSIQEKYNLLFYSVGNPAGWRVEPRVRLWRPWAHPGGPPQVRTDRTPWDVAQGRLSAHKEYRTLPASDRNPDSHILHIVLKSHCIG